jgi:putative SOS response-associated peptidase YedK
MCGRVIQNTPLGEIRVLFETVNAVPNSAPNYNGAPTQQLPVVRLDEEGRRSLDLLRWGLIPFWAKDPAIGIRCINAMAETAAAKPAFRDAFRRRRCLVPVDGFYEWQKRPAGKKQPYAIVSADGKPFAMAGLWENWKEPQSGETVRTFTIITGEPNELVAPIHNRMPVILPPSHWRAWLGEEPVPAEELPALLQPYPAERMRAYPVNVRVGNVRNNDAALIEPVALAS